MERDLRKHVHQSPCHSCHGAYWSLLAGKRAILIGCSTIFLSLVRSFGLDVNDIIFVTRGDAESLLVALGRVDGARDEFLLKDFYATLDRYRSINTSFAQKLVTQAIIRSFKMFKTTMSRSKTSGPRSASRSAVFSLAKFVNRVAPRGRGAIPRKLGRWVPEKKFYLSLEGNVQLVMSPGSLDVYCHLANRGQWEPHVLQTCEALLEKGDVFYDIGANVGYMAMSVGRRFDDTVSVIAFEPQPTLVSALQASADLNGFSNVRILDYMLSSDEGDGNLYISSHSTHASALPREASTTPLKCRKTSIDRLVSSGEIAPPNVIKIDIEGGELDCFRGATETLKDYRPHVVFESDENMERFGYSKESLLGIFESIGGYELFKIERNGAKLIPLDKCPADRSLGNMLARRK